ncbi:MAG: glycyl radical protein [Promethearchaeota archaeon]
MYLDSNKKLSIDVLRIETRVMKETEGEPMVTRRSKVFAEVVRCIPISILPDQLIVGSVSSQLGDVPVSSHNFPSVPGMRPGGGGQRSPEKDRDRFAIHKPRTGFEVKDELRRELKEGIIPYWKGDGNYEKTAYGRNYQKLTPELLNLSLINPENILSPPTVITGANMGVTSGHNAVDYEKVVNKGFLGIMKEAKERLNRISSNDPEESKKIPFLKGVIMSMKASAEIGERYAVLAREMAKDENDPNRKTDLLRIASVCERVPANPAATFHEALQSVWFTHVLLHLEATTSASHSAAKVDQYLYPYYEGDIREGRLTKKDAQELIDCFMFKYSEHGGGGSSISVGGFKSDGSDATNELSYMFIEGAMHKRLVWPNLDVLMHSKTPEDLLIKACQYTSLGLGAPVFINNDVLVTYALTRTTPDGPPITLQDARAWGKMGCVEPIWPGKDRGGNWTSCLSLGACMEFVMTNGMSRFHNRNLGLETGDPRHFKSFEEVREAYLKQMDWMVKNAVKIGNISWRTRAELYPSPFESALIEDCIERGISKEDGGAYFNNNSWVLAAGATDVGDSLTAIKKVIFDEKKFTMNQLCDALDSNFEGYENLHQMLLNAPKFGNDDDYADEQTAWVKHIWQTESLKHDNEMGGRWFAEGGPVGMEVVEGALLGALPSGRKAWEPMAPSESPCAGMDTNGPTAVIKSAGKVDNVELNGGMVLNMTLDPMIFESNDGFKKLADLLRTFIDEKIYHVQFNVVKADKLRAAQKEPYKYRNIVVKVSGFNAFFVDLAKSIQDHVIARTEHRM